MKIAFLALLLVFAFGFAFYMLLFEPDEMVSDINCAHLSFQISADYFSLQRLWVYLSLN